MTVVDFHQHLWPEPLVELLSRRERPPRLRGSTLELAGEPESEIDLGAHDLDARLALLDRWELDLAVVSLQPTLGIATLPDDEAAELVAAYERGILELAAASGGRLVPLAAGSDLAGFAGACIGAPELLDLDRLAPRLDELVRQDGVLFVHPGPAAGAPPAAPAWWAAVVDYTAQMQAAHAAWLAGGASRWPGLDVVFAMLAGGAPFQLERLRSRGVSGRDVLHDTVFFEISSYGNRALELCLATFGVSQLVFGTDVPVLDPEPALDAVRGFGDAVTDALCNQNPARLFASRD
ncbi:MAG: amidohydrolase [Actinomycetota bacterium]|nr:amidohydrolase [Actinomycetota bacterium]